MSDQENEVTAKSNKIVENIIKFIKSKSGKIIIYTVIIFSIGFFSGTEYIKYELRKAFSSFSSGVTNSFVSSSTRQEQEVKPKLNYINIEQGKTTNLKDFDLRIMSSQSLPSLTGKDNDYSSEKTVTARNGAKFILIEAEISNTGKESLSLYDSSFPLFDNKDRKYTPTQVYNVGLSGNYLTSQYPKPGFSEKGKLVYEIPNDSIDVYIQIPKKDTQDVYNFKLKL